MSFYIGTFEEVTAYNEKVNEAKAYNGNVTNNWANPRQHPDGSKWAIVANNSIEKDEESGLQQIEELGEDWTPEELEP
tara:strand:- start:203 stop:436 length:234 start_codon:yes stop_codon:yes gene_type:complete